MLVFVYFVFFLLCKILITIINLSCCILVSSREKSFWVRFVAWFSLVWSAVRHVIHVTCFCFWTTISNGCYMFCVVFLLSQFCLEKFVTVKNLLDRTVPIWLDVRILINDGCLQLTRSLLLLPFYQYWWSSTESRVLMLETISIVPRALSILCLALKGYPFRKRLGPATRYCIRWHAGMRKIRNNIFTFTSSNVLIWSLVHHWLYL